MREAHGHHVRGVDVLVERLLYEVLGLVPGQGSHPLVQEDQLEVEAATSLVDIVDIVDIVTEDVHCTLYLARNMKTFDCILISVMEEGGRL